MTTEKKIAILFVVLLLLYVASLYFTNDDEGDAGEPPAFVEWMGSFFGEPFDPVKMKHLKVHGDAELKRRTLTLTGQGGVLIKRVKGDDYRSLVLRLESPSASLTYRYQANDAEEENEDSETAGLEVEEETRVVIGADGGKLTVNYEDTPTIRITLVEPEDD